MQLLPVNLTRIKPTNPGGSTLNRRVLIGIVIAIVGVGLIGLGIVAINRVLRQSLNPPAQATPVVEATTSIIVTTHDLAVGGSLKSRRHSTRECPHQPGTVDALQTIEAALGKSPSCISSREKWCSNITWQTQRTSHMMSDISSGITRY